MQTLFFKHIYTTKKGSGDLSFTSSILDFVKLFKIPLHLLLLLLLLMLINSSRSIADFALIYTFSISFFFFLGTRSGMNWTLFRENKFFFSKPEQGCCNSCDPCPGNQTPQFSQPDCCQNSPGRTHQLSWRMRMGTMPNRRESESHEGKLG